MTPKQILFVHEYLVDLNATRAAVAAGYSEKTAKQIGSRLLTNVAIQQEITQKSIKHTEKIDITIDYVLTTIRNTIERCSREETYEASAVLKGAELLGKYKKLFTDKVETSGPDGGPIKYADLTKFSDEQIEMLDTIVASVYTPPSTSN